MTRRAATRRLRALLMAGVALVAGSLALLIESGRIWAGAELTTVDWRFEVRGERPPPDDVVVVGIDADTFGDLDQRFPFRRSTFATALDRIGAAGARAIVYDVQFTEPSGDTEEAIAEDNALLEASRRRGNVVYSTTEVAPDGTTNVFGGPEAQAFARARVGNGLLPIDPGNVLRRVPYEVDGIPSVAVATLRLLGRSVDPEAFGDDGAWIDYSGPAGHLRTVSFGDVVQGRAEPGLFRDRIAVVGATAPVLQDVHPTSFGDVEMSGPEIQASAIATLLRGAPLRGAAGWIDALIALGLAVFAPLLGLRARPLLSLGLTAGAAAAYLVAAQLSFDAGRILPVAGPLAGLAVGLVGALGVHYVTGTIERARMRDLFARFVPDSVVTELLARADSDDPRLGGVRLVSTVMFSDLRGFTTFAEDRDPELVIEVLNEYLTRMSDAILDNDGTLVTYMGDGVMAVFGAPIGSEDHADRALRAARDMLGRLEEFNAWMRERGFADAPFKMGIGLNTGGVMSGNVGSERRLEYAAIGDTTNTAARLEAMTKDSAYQCFVAGSTYEALSGRPDDLEFVDEMEVRGRQARIAVWGLRSGATVSES